MGPMGITACWLGNLSQVELPNELWLEEAASSAQQTGRSFGWDFYSGPAARKNVIC